jgi:hypothetical protein
VIGGLLIIGGLLFWKFAGPLSLVKGLTIPLFAFGLLTGLGGGVDAYFTKKALPEKIARYNKDKSAFFKEETAKVGKTHRSWKAIRWAWAGMSFVGLGLLLTMKKNYWIGVGLGTLLLGAAEYIAETGSMKFNEKYYHRVMDAADQQKSQTKGALNPVQQPRSVTDTVSKQDQSIMPSPVIKKEEIKGPFSEEDTCKRVIDSLDRPVLAIVDINNISSDKDLSIP